MTVYAPGLWPRKRRHMDRQHVHDAAIREATGIDPAIIAADLGITESFVRLRQRKMMLRKCRNPRDRDE